MCKRKTWDAQHNGTTFNMLCVLMLCVLIINYIRFCESLFKRERVTTIDSRLNSEFPDFRCFSGNAAEGIRINYKHGYVIYICIYMYMLYTLHVSLLIR